MEVVQSDGNTSSSISQSYRLGDFQDSSNSLFSNQDPWNLWRDNHFPPPRLSKIKLNKESFSARDASDDRANLNIDVSSEHSRPSKGSSENLIKQELHAIAEDASASVLRTCPPSELDLSGHGRVDSSSISHQNNEVFINKFEEVKVRLPEKINFGFPITDGHLQIIKNSDLEEIKELGSGTFGTVYYRKWRGTDVAIRRIND